MKRAQVSFFIILAVLVVIIAVSFFLLQTASEPEIPDIETATLKSYVEACMKSTAEEAVFHTGRNGGYFIPDGVKLEIPDDGKIADEIAFYIDTMLSLCLDFSSFSEIGYDISYDRYKSKTVISPRNIIIETRFPLNIDLSGRKAVIKSFRTEINGEQFYSDLVLARKVYESVDDGICLTCFAEMAEQNNVFVGIHSLDNYTLFDLRDDDYILDDEKYHFIFGVSNEE